MKHKSKIVHLDDAEKAIEKNFDRLKSYPPEIKAKKMKLYQQVAKNYLNRWRKL